MSDTPSADQNMEQGIAFARAILDAAYSARGAESISHAFAYSTTENTRFERIRNIVAQAKLDVDVAQDPAGNLYFSTKGNDETGSTMLFGGTLDTPRADSPYRGSLGPAVGLATMLMRQQDGSTTKAPRGMSVVLWRGGSHKPYYIPNMGAGFATGRLTDATLKSHGLLSTGNGGLMAAFTEAGLPPAALSNTLQGHKRLIPTQLVYTYLEFSPTKEVKDVTLVSERNFASVVSYDPVIFTSIVTHGDAGDTGKDSASNALDGFVEKLKNASETYANFFRIEFESPESHETAGIASVKSIGFHSYTDKDEGREQISSILPGVVKSFYPEIVKAAQEAALEAGASAFVPPLDTFVSMPRFDHDHFLNSYIPEICADHNVDLQVVGGAIPETAAMDFRRIGMNSAVLEVPSEQDGRITDETLKTSLKIAYAVVDRMFNPAESRWHSHFSKKVEPVSFVQKMQEFLASPAPAPAPAPQPGNIRKSRQPF